MDFPTTSNPAYFSRQQSAKAIPVIEQVFTILAMLFYSGAIGRFIGEDNPLLMFIETIAIIGALITVGLLVAQWKHVLSIARRDPWLWILLSITLFSFLWSDYPDVTFGKVVPLLRVTAFGVYFASRYTIHNQLRLLAVTFYLAASLSVLIALFLPYYGVMGAGLIVNMQHNQHTGVWRGAYIHKVMLGNMMAFGTLVCTYCYAQSSSRQYRWVMAIGATFCFGLLLMSTTKTALLGLISLVFLIPVLKILKLKSSLAIAIGIVVCVVTSLTLLVVTSNLEDILGLFGREASFSGRTNYWLPMIEKLLERPWFGYGYGTFAHGGWKGEIYYIWRLLFDGDEPPHAHNGLLNLALDVGLVGMTIFLISYGSLFWRSLRFFQARHTLDGLAPICFLVLFVVMNFTESMSMVPELSWAYYVSITLSIDNGLSRRLTLQQQAINYAVSLPIR